MYASHLFEVYEFLDANRAKLMIIYFLIYKYMSLLLGSWLKNSQPRLIARLVVQLPKSKRI
jgi:hypothetical protein